MNIVRYKNIDELIKEKDIYLAKEIDNDQLELISRGYKPTQFNVNKNDVLEFLLYDINNNLLEQPNYGNARYIKGEEIKNYLLVSTNPTDSITEGGGFVVDIKKLVKEAGYTSGYFRIQVNFLSNRVGSNSSKDKLWIQEISPSRLEARLLPFNNFNEEEPADSNLKQKLNLEYDTFLRGQFNSNEVYQNVTNVLNTINGSDIANMMRTILSQETITKLAQEFSIVSGYDAFYAKVLEDAKLAISNHILYRNSTIGDINFGKPILTNTPQQSDSIPLTWYNKEEIMNLINGKFKESLDYHLLNRNLRPNTSVDSTTQQSLDQLNDLVQTLQSNTFYGIPNVQKETVEFNPAQLPPPSDVIKDPPPPPSPPPPPPSPLKLTSGPTVSNITANTFEITWQTSEAAEAIIDFINGNCPSIGCSLIVPRKATSHYYQITGANPNTEYSFQITGMTYDNRKVISQTITLNTIHDSTTKTPYFDPYASTGGSSPTNPIDYSGGGGRGFIYTDSDGNPDTIEGSIRDVTGTPIN